ncbi:hypothetical protein NDR87_18800 [Nocardia sp. CDC159]|uniref:Uncharacterized protein n=1 Tax=Nocardia pulmonis TaxID=2951408 RepID=A0A9X2IZP0_9NOCA|nr:MULTISPECIES: hypothetical protein [Nocardia]MCM6776260.1 hypothetical protein [Nocardia pulmonis]MCM6788414.1 hypothetical protein [Nocardia sp. CDC159]
MPTDLQPGVDVTTWSARKRHHPHPTDRAETRCHRDALRPGQPTMRGDLTQPDIDALPLCGLCASARKEPADATE